MARSLNGAGLTAADPILKGLPIDIVFIPESADVAEIEDAWIDTASGFPGTNSVKPSLHPNASLIEKGVAASYNDANDRLTIGATLGLSAGDWIFLSHASITDGIYQIATVPSSTQVTLQNDPFAGGGNQSGIVYQVAWGYDSTTSVSPWVSSALGTQNWLKSTMNDGVNSVDEEDYTYVRDADARVIEINSGGDDSRSGEVVGSNGPIVIGICTNWASNGGVSHVQPTAHSVQGVNQLFWDVLLSDQGEKTVAAAEGVGFYVPAGDGPKYSRLILRSMAGGGSTLAFDLDVTLDTAGPTVSILLRSS